MEEYAIQKTVASGLRKMTMLREDTARYLLRSVQAGLYLALITFLFWNLMNDLSGSPFGKVVASLFFGVGLFIIVITGAELFTSNNMYMTASSLTEKTSWSRAIGLWVVCYLGNLVGASLFAGLLYGAGITDVLPAHHALVAGAFHKAEQTSQVIFFKGILANWVVCLAVWVSMHLKEDIARMMAIIAIVFIFLYLGFEHSIANMGTFTVALLAHNDFTVSQAVHNLIWATLGNIVGGGFLIGAAYWYLNKKVAGEEPTHH